jgi:hypothetical protein
MEILMLLVEDIAIPLYVFMGANFQLCSIPSIQSSKKAGQQRPIIFDLYLIVGIIKILMNITLTLNINIKM